MKRWTLVEEEFLRTNWPNMNIHELTADLNKKFKTERTEDSVDGKIDRMKLSRKREYCRRFDENDEAKLEGEGREKTIELLRIKHIINELKNIRIQIKAEGPNSTCKILDGTIVFKNQSLVVVKTENYPESFKYVDFYTGRAVII